MEDRPRRYPSDTTDEQWAIIEPLLPPVRTGGRPEKHPRRAIVDAILYVVRTGCSWRQLPADFPPWQTVYWYFNQWEQARVDREDPARGARPAARAGRPQPRTHRRAHRLPERQGRRHRRPRVPRLRRREEDQRPQAVHRHRHPRPAAGRRRAWPPRVQDRDGAKSALLDTYLRTPVRFVFADGGFAGRLVDWASQILRTTLHIVRKPADQRGFAVIPRRWAVERTFAWLTAHRRLARDYERHPAMSEAMIRWAAINTMTRRIARGGPATRQQRRTFPATS